MLLTLMLFQTCMSFFLLITKEAIVKKIGNKPITDIIYFHCTDVKKIFLMRLDFSDDGASRL